MNTTPRILIVEDEVGLAELLKDYLTNAGYAAHMLHEGNGAVDWIRQNNPALVLLDLMLPGVDGMEICRQVRAFSQVPVIMTTARVEEIDRLLGLEIGADDYVCKPYSPREVVARVKTVLRRTTAVEAVAGAEFIRLDEEAFKVVIEERPLEVTPVEFRLLKAFTHQPGRVFSRGQLMESLYTDQRVVSDRTVDTHVKNLRKKLEAHLPEQKLIHSIYGVGYKLELNG